MAHELTPRPGNAALTMEEVVRRLRNGFSYVVMDEQRASEQLNASAQHMARIGHPHFSREDIERARQSIGRASYVIVADDPNADLAYLSFLLEPEHETIFISYESGAHEDRSRELRERLASVLDYEIELV